MNAYQEAPATAPAPSRFYALHLYRAQLRSTGTLKSLSQTAALTLLALADFADPSGYCWPSLARLVAENPMGERSAQRALRELEERGLIVRELRPGRSAVVRLVMDLEALGDRAAGTPATTAAAPARKAKHPRHDGTLNRSGLTPQGSKQQQTTAAPAPVVAESSSNEDQADKLPRDLYERLRAIGVRAPWRLAPYGEDRIRQALVMLQAAKNVGNPAGWLASCLKHGWEKAAESKTGEALTEATREHLTNITEAKAQLADPEQAKRSKLGLVAAIVQMKRPTDAALAQMLERHGLTLQDWEGYRAERVGIEAGAEPSAT